MLKKCYCCCHRLRRGSHLIKLRDLGAVDECRSDRVAYWDLEMDKSLKLGLAVHRDQNQPPKVQVPTLRCHGRHGRHPDRLGNHDSNTRAKDGHHVHHETALTDLKEQCGSRLGRCLKHLMDRWAVTLLQCYRTD